MLKTHMAACLLATALVAGPALAQSTTAPAGDRPAATDNRTGTMGSPAMNAPGTPGAPSTAGSGGSTMGTAGSTAGSSSTMGTSGSSPNMASNNATQSLQPGQFLASDLIGTRVVGQNNDSIGDVNDVVMGQDGKAMMLVVGVGGFLGIGEKDVAIPFEQAQIRFDAGETRGAGNAGAPNTTGSTGGTPATGGTGGGSNATTGSSGAQQSASSNEPQRIVINMTKEQLQQAPSFRTSGASDNNASGNAGSRPGGATGTGTGTGTGNTNRP